jgi:hypothetical protein
MCFANTAVATFRVSVHKTVIRADSGRMTRMGKQRWEAQRGEKSCGSGKEVTATM